MKVLHVIETLGHGGAEQLLVTVLPELSRQGVQTSVAVRRGSMALRDALENAGVAVTRLPECHKWNLWSSAREIAKLAEDSGADVIHAHMYFPAVSTALTRILRMTTARTCVTFHNLAYGGANQKGMRLSGKKRLAQLLYPRGQCGYLAVSRAVAEHYSDALNLKDIRVVHNAVDMTELNAVTALHRDPEEPFHIIVPGRLVDEKGHDDFLTVLEGLDPAARDLRITFAGDGPRRDDLEARVGNSAWAGRVRFTGALKHDAFLSELAGADLVVVPSHYEGFGLVALEAMALGCPVIATTAGGLPEVMGDTGILIPPRDPAALEKALVRMLDDPALLESAAKAGQARARAQFSVEAMASGMINFYHHLPRDPRLGGRVQGQE